jgi:type IV pilus assembly protein PilA
MLARLRKLQEENEGGFTLIELLVVIIIIGILAAIAIPTFLNQREKGYKADMKSAAKNAATAVESFATETNGNYMVDEGVDGWVNEDLAGEGFRANDNIFVVVDSTETSYCITVADARFGGSAAGNDGDVNYYYSSEEGAPLEGTCP